jgi:hypothetical protein
MEKELTACKNCKHHEYSDDTCYAPDVVKKESYFDPYEGKFETATIYGNTLLINKDGHCPYFEQLKKAERK